MSCSVHLTETYMLSALLTQRFSERNYFFPRWWSWTILLWFKGRSRSQRYSNKKSQTCVEKNFLFTWIALWFPFVSYVILRHFEQMSCWTWLMFGRSATGPKALEIVWFQRLADQPNTLPADSTNHKKLLVPKMGAHFNEKRPEPGDGHLITGHDGRTVSHGELVAGPSIR